MAPPEMNGKCKAVMISSYLERPLRTLEKAIEDRAQAPGALSARPAVPPAVPPADPDVTGPDSIELLVRLLSENTDQDGAPEALSPAAARQRSPLDRFRAA